MANVIKLKRGSGSDPSASDLVVGEVAIRTDSGKLFTKKDNGTIAEISGSGGGSDIFINTLSSSSGSGGGSATFNGTATRFTLSNPPSVSAQQLLVSINGVIQKPNSGTSPSEGFAIDGNDIIFAAAPATGSDFFIVTYGSLNIAVPADNSVTSAKIVDGAIVNADINASAAIAGTKISPDFGSQNIVTTGGLTIDTSTLHVDTSNNRVGIGTTSVDRKFHVEGTDNVMGKYQNNKSICLIEFQDTDTTAGNRPCFGSDANNAVIYAGGSEKFRVKSSGNVGIGTASPAYNLDLSTSSGEAQFRIDSSAGNHGMIRFSQGGTNKSYIQHVNGNHLAFGPGGTTKMTITSTGDFLFNRTSAIVSETFTFTSTSGNMMAIHQEQNSDVIGMYLRHGYAASGQNGKMLSFRRNDGTEVGSITIGNGSISVNGDSDYRLKENEVAISDGITRLKTLKPYKFNFKDDPDYKFDGFFAHEVSTAVPEAVQGVKDAVNEDGSIKAQQIDQTKLIPLLTAALQEAVARIEALEAG